MTTIHQMLPNYMPLDAIGNCVTGMRDLLRGWGYESEIFANVIHESLEARNYRLFGAENDDSYVIYHYSTGSPVNRFALDNAERMILMYHNITPARFFSGFNEDAERNCREGRDLLKKFAGKVKFAMAGSPYNARELEEMGFGSVAVVPYILDFQKIEPSGTRPFDDDKTNILFVGRISPNKRYEDLLKIFYFYRKYVNTNSRLVLVGGYGPAERYYLYLQYIIDSLEIPDVHFAGFVPDGKMGDYYENASLFLCMSQHEGFCIPVIEAMRFRLPVVALAGTAVTDTMGYAGALVNRSDPNEIAELMGLILEDNIYRSAIIETQLKRVDDFSKDKMTENFHQVIKRAVNGVTA